MQRVAFDISLNGRTVSLFIGKLIINPITNCFVTVFNTDFHRVILRTSGRCKNNACYLALIP